MLTDTGPIVALLDKDDDLHIPCVEAVKHMPVEPMLTTWPCFTEAMYLLGTTEGHRYQAKLWTMRSSGALMLHEPSEEEIARMPILMEKHRDTPMDLADASLVAAAEGLGLTRLFTIDSDFYVYRLVDGTALEVVR